MTSRADKQLSLFLDSDAIDGEFFCDVVQKQLKISREEFHLRLVALTPATGKNENFMSVVLRAAIKIQIFGSKAKHSIDVIIKALLRETDENMKDLGVFQRERYVYETIIDSFESIWLQRIGEKIQFAPTLLKVTQTPYETIILEDLRCKNYSVVDRKAGLDLKQSEIVLKKLARFHATGAIYLQEIAIGADSIRGCLCQPLLNPQTPVKETFNFNFLPSTASLFFQNATFDECLDRKVSMKSLSQDGGLVKGFTKFFNVFLETVGNLDGCSKFCEKIARWDLPKLFQSWMLATEPMKNGFTVLNHGDVWVNNLLLSPNDVLFIDFQICFHGSPASDLLYFLVTSVCDDDKVLQFDHLVQFYHAELRNALENLGYEKHVPTLEELYQDLLEKGSFACSRLMLILLIVKNDAQEEFDLSDILNTQDMDFLKSCYRSESYRKALRTWLPFLNERGFLDSLI